LNGKDLPEALDGWRTVYEQMKPHIGVILDWLRTFPRGGEGGPPMPPTIMT
jgi:hypothetical protein